MSTEDDTKAEIKAWLAANLAGFKADADAYGLNANGPDDDDPQGLELTIATTDWSSWGWQTGDNSYSGGAYSYQHWAVTWITPDTEADELGDEIIDQLDECFASMS